MISATQAAKKLCESSGWTLTNLALQKMLYIAHMYYMGESNGASKLIDTTTSPFQAWEYGPVSPAAYARVRVYGSGPIGNVFRTVASADGSGEANYLQLMYDVLNDWTPGQLVAFTHRKGGAWDRFYDPNRRHIIIPDEAILDEYRHFKQ